MVGHIYKDFKVAWMTFFLLGCIAAFVIVMVFVYSEGDTDASAEEALVVLSGLALLNMTAPLVAMEEVAAADEKERWVDFVMILPRGLKTYVRSKYVFILLISFIVGMFTHIFCMVVDALWNNPWWSQISPHAEYMIIGAASGFGMLAASFFFPFVFRFGIKLGNAVSSIFVFFLCVSFYIFIMFGDVELLENGFEKMLQYLLLHYRMIAGIIKALLPIGLAAMLGSCALSVRVCRQSVARREYWE